MTVNIVISAAALDRYNGRSQNDKMTGGNKIEKWLDNHFDDERMEQIYPNAKMIE